MSLLDGAQDGAENGALLFESNEVGFAERDVRAVCDLGSSSKSQRQAIGRKGLGFKSCFAVSDRPHVASGGYSFRFDASGGLYGALVPEWIEPDDVRALVRRHLQPLGLSPISLNLRGASASIDGDAFACEYKRGATSLGTSIWLPLRGAAPPLFLAPTALLFLRKLHLIELVTSKAEVVSIRRLDSCPPAASPASAAASSAAGASVEGAPGAGVAQRVSLVVNVSGRASRRRGFVLWKETHQVDGTATELVLAFRDEAIAPKAAVGGVAQGADGAEAPLFAVRMSGHCQPLRSHAHPRACPTLPAVPAWNETWKDDRRRLSEA